MTNRTRWRSNYQVGEGLAPINRFSRHIFYPCPTPVLGFSRSCIVVFVMLNDVKGAVIVRFVGIINSYCLNFLFRKTSCNIIMDHDVRSDFYIKMMFGSFLHHVVCKRTHVLFTLFAFVFA